jgi:uncharacterized membrane protein YeaQ/YmgE (transglycosylase-associated protein family)
MSIGHFLLLLLVAGVAGGLGQAIAGYSRGGCLTCVALGFVGALVGSWLARVLGLPSLLVLSFDGQPFPLVWAILGAALFVGVLGFLSKPRRRGVPRP